MKDDNDACRRRASAARRRGRRAARSRRGRPSRAARRISCAGSPSSSRVVARRSSGTPLAAARSRVSSSLRDPARLPRELLRRRDRDQRQPRPVGLGDRDGVRQRELGLGRTVEGDQHVAVAHGCILAPARLAVPWTMPPSHASPSSPSTSAPTSSPGRSSRWAGRRARSGWCGRSPSAPTSRARSSSISTWFDPWIKRARIAHAADDTLEYVPPWYGERMLAIGRERGAAITLSGPVAPGSARRSRPGALRSRPAAGDPRERRGREPA